MSDQQTINSENLMGTLIRTIIPGEVPHAVTDAVFDLLRSLEARLTVNSPSASGQKSQLKEINDSAGVSAVVVDSDVYSIVRKAVDASLEYRDSFNAFLGPVVKAWGIGFDNPRIRSDDEISELLKLTNPEDAVLDNERQSVFLTRKNMQLDLGAIAKGYAADLAGQLYNSSGIYQGLIDLGGNVLAMGGSDRAADGYWRIGIQSPFDSRGAVAGTLAIRDASVVTSGIYERIFESGGKKYHHMIDPQTGHPFETDLASVTVIAGTSLEADLWATILQSGGLDEAYEKAEGCSDIEAVFITRDSIVVPTPAIRNWFSLTDNSFRLN